MTAKRIKAPATVACIGLGAMGLPIAKQLAGAGYSVVGYDLDAALRAQCEGFGATAASCAAEAIAAASAVVTLLPSGTVVQAVLLAPEVREALQSSQALIIEMSSSAPNDTLRLAEELGAIGVRVVDAPVSGGVSRAEDGSLAIMVGGAQEDVESSLEILEVLGRSVVPTGPLGSGHAMKALNNFLSAIGLAAASEAVLVGERFGLQATTMLEVLNQSSGRNNSTENKMAKFVLSQAFNSGFSLELMAKDLGIARDLARQSEQFAPMTEACAKLWQEGTDKLPGADHTEIFRFLRDPKSP